MQVPVRIPYNRIDKIDVMALIYSTPVSDSPSSSSDATHSDIDNKGYQIGGSWKRSKERGPSKADFEVRSGDCNRQPHLTAGGTH
jgi:hypothetical protein